MTDGAGTKLADMSGWLEPCRAAERLLHACRSTNRSRGPPPEIFVERLVGPFMSSSDQKVEVFVDLGADREARTHVLRYTMVLYDDALPRSIRNATVGAGVSVVVALIGFVFCCAAGGRIAGRKSGRHPL